MEPCVLPFCGVLGWNHVHFRSLECQDGTMCTSALWGVRMDPCALPLCGVSGWTHVHFRSVGCQDGTMSTSACPLPLVGVSAQPQKREECHLYFCGVSGWNHVYFRSVECEGGLGTQDGTMCTSDRWGDGVSRWKHVHFRSVGYQDVTMSTSACPLPLVGVSEQPQKSAMCSSALWGVRMEACVVSGGNHVHFRSVGCQVGTLGTSALWGVRM
ncbi:hypothetical protein NDU88_000928 [Pleurodeles waltl]|uniref:Uncharacterized protein n=1 Tax=Pleurodeles waltl TaxID=8319 RepID=A0AAV7MT88_PLEWA|nr:hypothetical protein NDU88_000928 [Pleurodeles waltl]